MRTDNDRQKFLEELRTTGNVIAACGRSKVPRANVYRWRSESRNFKRRFEEALSEGRETMNHAAEGVVFEGIKNKDYKMVQFYLKHRHPDYMNPKDAEAREKEPNNLTDLIKKGLGIK